MINSTAWQGFRELVLVNKIQECPDIISFYFKPKDNKKLMTYKAGQFLPFKIKTSDSLYQNVIRTYSLSLLPNENIYRISVKKVPGGLISTMLHEQFKIGDSIEAMPPAGLFTIQDRSNKPLMLLSAGIGITPLLSMVYEEVKTRNNIHFVQAVQNSENQPFKKNIDELVKTRQIKTTVFYSNPLETDEQSVHYDELGFISLEWLKQNMPLNADYYFCGPPPFMLALEKNLLALGVAKECIHFEYFNK
ncbi:MAG: FAD-binding oxidoreductase [Turicibacter sp.]